MAGQIINLGTSPWGVSNDSPYQPDPGILIDPSLVSGGGTAYFRHYHQLGTGNAQFYTDSSATGGSPIGAGPDLTPAWEIADEAITFAEEGGSSLILKGPNHPDNTFSDPSESYFWTPDNRSAHASWITNVGDGAISMILWDGVGTKPGTTPPVSPLALSDFDQTGLEIVLLANIEAGLEISGDNRTYYADSNFTPVTGSLLDGELGLSVTETLVSRFQYIFQGSNIGQIRLNDNDDPVALNLEDYFAGDGADLTLYVQTADSLVTIPVAANIASDGSGFIRISIPTADGRAVLNAIGDGTQLNFAFARSAFNAHAVNAGAVAWTFAVPQPAVTHTRAHAVDAGNIDWSFAVPQPTVTHTSIQPQSHAVNAGAVNFNFAVPQPTILHLPASTPERITRLEIENVGQNTALIEWDRPNSMSPITDYEVRIDAGAWISTGTTATMHMITGLAVGTGYSVTVRAVNAHGEGPASNPLVIRTLVARAPTVPLFSTAMPTGETSVDLSWTVPLSDGGSPITHYEICVIDEDGRALPFEFAGSETRTRVRGLAIGHRYGFRVRAVNGAGTGAQTELVYATPKRERILTIPPGQRLPLLDVDRQSLILRLADMDCRVRVSWNVAEQAWFGDLEVPVNTEVVQGVRLAIGSGILDRIQGVLPGNIVCRNLDSIDELEPARDAWVRPTHALVWEPE